MPGMRRIVFKRPRLIFSIAGMLLGLAYGYFATSQATAMGGERLLCGTGVDLIVPIWAFWGLAIGLLFGNELRKFARATTHKR